ncbi:hypothetical protein RMQ97_03135 [Maricaulis sp. D1M11]|uniref:hypothetical protein n=1 Tax=Maricaulis sp. D1M11 TaxID=3076117 RepID=UPI0039B4ED26
MKTLALALIVAASGLGPVMVPMALGIPVTVRIGPVEAGYDEFRRFDLDLAATCVRRECPMFEWRLGDPDTPGLRLAF